MVGSDNSKKDMVIINKHFEFYNKTFDSFEKLNKRYLNKINELQNENKRLNDVNNEIKEENDFFHELLKTKPYKFAHFLRNFRDKFRK